MSQVSYGTITIVDTTDIGRIYMVYAKSVSNTTPPSDELTWSESIASAPGEGDFIWQKTVVEKAITEEKTYSDPVCVTGSSGQGVEKIINYYCNYGQGQPEEDYSGWQLEIPEYDGNKPNYWTKVVVIYSDDTREDFQASGTIATFESEKVGTLDSLEVTLNPKQSGSGTPSPTNIRPISGWDEVETVVSGKNLCDNSVFGTYGLVEQSDGSWYADNNNKIYDKVVWQNDRGIEGQLAIVFKYRYSNADYVGAYPTVYYTDGTRRNLAVTKTTVPTEISTVTQSGKIVDCIVMVYSSNGAQSYVNLMVTEDLTATTYEPYQGHTYTTDLPQTVYGGTLDVVSGVLTVDRASVDFGSLSWASNTLNGVIAFYVQLNDAKLPSSNSVKANILSSAYATDTANNIYSDTSSGRFSLNTSGYIQVRNSNYSDASTFKTDMTGQKIVYELATPTTIQCDPQTVQTLMGDNNVWGGDTVEVRGHTISKRDVMIYKDNGLTDVVNKSAEANTNAAEALEKANDGIVSTTQLWYQTNSTGAPSVPTSHSQVDQGTVTYNNWRSARPNNNVDSYKYYYYCYEYLHGDGTYTYSAEAILDTSNLSQYQIDQLQVRIKKMWSNSTGSYMASGIGTNEVNIDNSSTYGFNSKSTTTGVSFNYNTIPLTSLGTDGINLYSPKITGGVITGSNKALTIKTTGMELFLPDNLSTSVASFGESTRIGNQNTNHLQLDSDSIDFMDGNMQIGYVGADSARFPIMHILSRMSVGNKYEWRTTPSGSLGLYLM